MTQKHCLEFIVNQEKEGGLTMMNQPLIPRQMPQVKGGGGPQPTLNFIYGDGGGRWGYGLSKANSTETLAVSVRLFPGCRKPLIFMGTVFPNLYSHIFQSIPSRLRDTLSQTDGWAESPPHSRLPVGHLPAQPQARREPASTATGLQRLP